MFIDEGHAGIVRRIFDLYTGTDSLSLMAITDLLNLEGVPSPKGGKCWYKATVKAIVSNPIYIGHVRFSGYVAILPELAIVDREVFDRAQKLRQRNRAESTRNRKYDYLLIGHIKCTCGFRSRGVSKGSPDHLLLYYACPCVVYEHKCDEKAVRADLADKLVWDWLVGILNNDEVRNEGLRLQAEERATLMEPKRKRLVVVHDLVDQAEKKIKRLANAIANVDDETAVSALQAELRIASKEKVSLTEELDRLTIELEQDELSERSIEAINARVEQVRRELENPAFETKRGLLDDLDVQTRLVREGDKRFLGVSCVLTPEHLRIPRDGNGRLGSDDLGQHSPLEITVVQLMGLEGF